MNPNLWKRKYFLYLSTIKEIKTNLCYYSTNVYIAKFLSTQSEKMCDNFLALRATNKISL